MTSLAEKSDDEIRTLLLRGITDPVTLNFVRDLYEDHPPEEIPSLLRHLSRAAKAFESQPADFDFYQLSYRQFDELLGGPSELPEEIPGVAILGWADMPLFELEKRIGPKEFSWHVRNWGVKLDAERVAAEAQTAEIRAKLDEALAIKFRHP